MRVNNNSYDITFSPFISFCLHFFLSFSLSVEMTHAWSILSHFQFFLSSFSAEKKTYFNFKYVRSIARQRRSDKRYGKVFYRFTPIFFSLVGSIAELPEVDELFFFGC